MKIEVSMPAAFDNYGGVISTEVTLVEDGRGSRVAAGPDYSCATILGSR